MCYMLERPFFFCTKQGLRRLAPLNWFVFEKGRFCFVVFLTKPDLRRLAPVIKIGWVQKRLFSLDKEGFEQAIAS